LMALWKVFCRRRTPGCRRAWLRVMIPRHPRMTSTLGIQKWTRARHNLNVYSSVRYTTSALSTKVMKMKKLRCRETAKSIENTDEEHLRMLCMES